jgi:hypothetical protein
LPHGLHLKSHRDARARRVVLLAGIHAALQSLGWPAKGLQHPRGQTRTSVT